MQDHETTYAGLRSLRIERSNDRVYESLRDAITSGVLAPGHRLIETRLAARLGVSRAPVREAIRFAHPCCASAVKFPGSKGLRMNLPAAILILVLLLFGPLAVHYIERNIEVYILALGVIATLIGTGFSWNLVRHTLTEPILITLAVIAAGILFGYTRGWLARLFSRLRRRIRRPRSTPRAAALLTRARRRTRRPVALRRHAQARRKTNPGGPRGRESAGVTDKPHRLRSALSSRSSGPLGSSRKPSAHVPRGMMLHDPGT